MRLTQEPVEFAADNAVTFTCGFFEAPAIENRNLSAPIADQAAPLQRAGDDRDPGTPGAQHFGEELMGDMEFVAFHAIVRHEQPAATALLDRVKSIAGGELRELSEERVGIQVKRLREWSPMPGLSPQHGGTHPKSAPGQLPKRSSGSPIRAQNAGSPIMPSYPTVATSVSVPFFSTVTMAAAPTSGK